MGAFFPRRKIFNKNAKLQNFEPVTGLFASHHSFLQPKLNNRTFLNLGHHIQSLWKGLQTYDFVYALAIKDGEADNLEAGKLYNGLCL